MMIPRVWWLEHSFTNFQGKKFVRKIIVLNLHILSMVFNGYLSQKYYCVQIDGFLELGQEGGSASQKMPAKFGLKTKKGSITSSLIISHTQNKFSQ